jgi:hypothetical protein
MKAFYIIHISVIIETILAIFFAIKLHEVTLKLRNFGATLEEKAESKLVKIRRFRELIVKFTDVFFITKSVIKNFVIQGFVQKFILPKNNFLKKISTYNTAIFWFLVTFSFFRKKNV